MSTVSEKYMNFTLYQVSEDANDRYLNYLI